MDRLKVDKDLLYCKARIMFWTVLTGFVTLQILQCLVVYDKIWEEKSIINLMWTYLGFQTILVVL